MAERKDYFELLVNKFTEESAKEFREILLSESKKDAKKPAIVWIDTNGGAIDALATMVETIESVANEVITACVGRAMSAGAILLSCGSKRYCGRNCRVIIHECLVGLPKANVHEVAAHSKEALRMNEYWLDRLAKNCLIEGGYDALKKIFKEREDDRTIYLNAEEALKFGIVDFIGVPRIEVKTIYEVVTSSKA